VKREAYISLFFISGIADLLYLAIPPFHSITFPKRKKKAIHQYNTITGTRDIIFPTTIMSLPDQDELSLSIEILSCRDLLISDRNKSSDPYVKVTLGDKDLHKTKHILKT
jgi:hypothetical protein